MSDRVAICLFCDDIRQELGNKFSLMGVYGSDLIFPVEPQNFLLPKFAAFVTISSDLDDAPTRISISGYIPPNRTEIVKLEMPELPPVSHPEDATRAHFRTVLEFPPFVIGEDGVIEVVISTERETIRAGRLFVHFVPPSPPPDKTD
jgi:hypothetical protein